jgi:predicted component of type VI protein secretion system
MRGGGAIGASLTTPAGVHTIQAARGSRVRPLQELADMPLFVVLAGESPIEVAAESVTLGRDPSCDIVVSDSSVSRRHATISRADRSWVLTDLGSANGTFVRGRRVSSVPLDHDQEIILGVASIGINLQPEADADGATMTLDALHKSQRRVDFSAVGGRAGRPARPNPIPVSAIDGTMNVKGRAEAPTGMGFEDACELLGLPAGASAGDAGHRFRQLHNDYQIRLTNAPTAALKRLYQKNLQELKVAARLLGARID